MTSVQRKRLKRFISYLNRLPKKGFDMEEVCSTKSEDINPRSSCRTAACAIGNLPRFNPTRFGYKFNPDYNQDTEDKFPVEWLVRDKVTNETNFIQHGVDYFGLTYDQSEFCFTPWQYEGEPKKITPKHVAKRLQLILDGKLNEDSKW